ncbi:MAG: hypothetical protein CL517_02725 [Actinobacteria bacterium]|nr:hypothetical protein [Actinomycetota bacterium]|tara:strand:+ start:25412 stop:26020 length:609 start_codon:yes stop_codon:yes gene_type:complete
MNLNKGDSWGSATSLPADGLVVQSNEDLFKQINAYKRNEKTLPVFGLLGGDLWRTLGGRSDRSRLHKEGAAGVNVDLGCILLDGKIFWFSSHVLIGKKFFGEMILISNVAYYGKMNVAPKAHPGDGRLDVLKIDLNFGQKLKALRRAASGTHVPHPGIRYERVKAEQFDLPKNSCVRIDGQKVGNFSNVSFRIEEQALKVIV